MKRRKFLSLLLLVLLLSCGKDDKNSEYVGEDTKIPEQDKKEEVKNEVSKDTSSAQQNSLSQQKLSSDKTSGNNDKSGFLSEQPVAVVSPLEAGDYNGKTVTVKGFVADVYKSEKVAYLNFVEKYPDNPFTVVIFASKFGDFPEIEKYKNKDIEVTGRVSIFRGKPQIILNSPSQIKD